MDLPHINVLTKIDNLQNYPPLDFNLDFYTEVHDLTYLLPKLEAEQAIGPTQLDAVSEQTTEIKSGNGKSGSKFAALNQAITGLIEDFALVGFETLAVEDKKSMTALLKAIDRAGGYAFGAAEGANDTVWQVAMRSDAVTMEPLDVQERWLDRREEFDKAEREAWEEEGKTWKGDGDEAEYAGDSGIKIIRKGS